MHNKEETSTHHYEHVYVVWISSSLVTWEFIVPQLNDRNFHCVVDVSETISLVVYLETEDTESPWGLEFVFVGWRRFVLLFKGNLVIRIEHDELELHVISYVWDPLSVLLSINIYIVFNINLTFVIFWIVESIWLITYFIVSNVIYSKNASFLKVPLHHFGAKNKVWR